MGKNAGFRAFPELPDGERGWEEREERQWRSPQEIGWVGNGTCHVGWGFELLTCPAVVCAYFLPFPAAAFLSMSDCVMVWKTLSTSSSLSNASLLISRLSWRACLDSTRLMYRWAACWRTRRRCWGQEREGNTEKTGASSPWRRLMARWGGALPYEMVGDARRPLIGTKTGSIWDRKRAIRNTGFILSRNFPSLALEP